MRDQLQKLQTQRTEMQEIESNRKLLSKQLAMVREAETLGTAIGSHQLNSLSQRYAVYKRTKTEYNTTRQALQHMVDECIHHMNDYQQSICAIKRCELIDALQELEQLTTDQLPVSEFLLVKDFLENSNQGALFIQSDQTRKELDTSLLQQTTILNQIIDSLTVYSSVVCFHPQSYINQHRSRKYAEWCQYLNESPSVVACRDIVAQFQKCHCENAAQSSVQHVLAFSYQLQAILGDENFKLQKMCERLNVELLSNDQHNIVKLDRAYEESRGAIGQFLQEEKGAKRALECVTLTEICNLNKRLLMMESAAVSSGDNLVDLTLNGRWFLDEMYITISTISELIKVVWCNESSSSELTSAINCFQATTDVYNVLSDINSCFSSSILSSVMHGIISEEQSCLDMISNLSSVQEGLQPLPELLTNLHLHLRCSVLNMASPNSRTIDEVNLLRQKLDIMKNLFTEDTTNITLGKQLFLLFNGLFDRLDDKHQVMVTAMCNLEVSDKWRKIDQIKESRDIAVSLKFLN